MKQYNRRQLALVIVVVVVLFFTLMAIYDTAGADGPGKKNDPLPTQSNACNAPGKGPEHKCNQPKPTQKPTAQPTKIEAQPTAVPTKVKPDPTQVKSTKPVVLPQVTAQPTATATPALTACSDTETCNPCEFLTDALEDGMMVIIIDRDKVEVYEDMSIRIPGQFDLLATGLLSESGYGD